MKVTLPCVAERAFGESWRQHTHYTPRFKIVVDQNKFVDDVMFYLTDPQLWVLSPSFQRQKL